MKIQKYIALFAASVSMVASAQTVTFDTQDYKGIGVYDTWEESPFRTGVLKGNVKVVANHLADPSSNPSSHILGVQRSRFGSNTFGVKVDLNESFELTPERKYVHVFIHKPIDCRVMLIGLGRRADRADQTEDIEQFWAYPSNDVKTGEWFDAVFPVKGNGGIDINSLVVVPHLETTHDLNEDFVVYIDNIEVSDDNRQRIGLGAYPVNFQSDITHSRSDRRTTSVSLTSPTGGSQSIAVSEPYMAYHKIFDKTFQAKAGEQVSLGIGYQGIWMHGYVFLDKGCDGEFSTGVTSNIGLDESKDLISFSLFTNGDEYSGKNSAGTTISSSNSGFNCGATPPPYTLPSDLPVGIYRMRYKVDWNSIDPGGAEDINDNGGIIVDVLLNLHGDNITVNQDNRNGEILIAESGKVIDNDKLPFGQPLKIKMVPSNGFAYNGVRVRHGYNLTGDSLVYENPQYRDTFFYTEEFDEDNCITIPGSVMDGDVLLEGLFVEKGTEVVNPLITYNVMLGEEVVHTESIRCKSGSDYPHISVTSEASPDYYSITGYPEGSVGSEDETVELTLEQNLPFETSMDSENAEWYNLAITAQRNYLTYAQGQTYIGIGTTTTVLPGSGDYNSQWAFVGNVITGFKIINRGAGNGYILSSSTETSANTGGSTFPVMRELASLPSGYNTYWMPTKSSDISGYEGFYLHQLGILKNRMNSRDDRLAFWTGGADGGSTFTLVHADSTNAIDGVYNDSSADGNVEYYTIQGVKVNTRNLVPGIYIRKTDSHVEKVFVK